MFKATKWLFSPYVCYTLQSSMESLLPVFFVLVWGFRSQTQKGREAGLRGSIGLEQLFQGVYSQHCCFQSTFVKAWMCSVQADIIFKGMSTCWQPWHISKSKPTDISLLKLGLRTCEHIHVFVCMCVCVCKAFAWKQRYALKTCFSSQIVSEQTSEDGVFWEIHVACKRGSQVCVCLLPFAFVLFLETTGICPLWSGIKSQVQPPISLPCFFLKHRSICTNAPGAILIFKDMLGYIHTNAKSKQGKFLIMTEYLDPDLTPPDCSGVVPTSPRVGKIRC